jgi:hypothetical protein
MSYHIDQANRSISTIDRKLVRSSFPVIISILIAFGLGADAINRIRLAFIEDDERRSDRNNAANFNRDLDSFSDSDNSAGFMIALEDELSTVVTFEPKLPELREAMATLFQDFNQNIADWDESEIPNVEVFKIRISALTANIEDISDENLMDVLRLVQDEIDRFRADIQVWANNAVDALDLEDYFPILEFLGGILLVLGTIAATGKRRNKLVQERYSAVESKIDAISEIIELLEKPTEIVTHEDVKLSVLRLLLEMRSPDKSYAKAITMRHYSLSRIISHIYKMDEELVGEYINAVKDLIESVYESNDSSYSYSFDAAMDLRKCMDRAKYIKQKYKSIKAMEAAEGAPVIESEDDLIDLETRKTPEEEPTMLRVVSAVMDEKVSYLLSLNNKLAVNASTLAFSQSIVDSYKSFCEAVPTNNLDKAIHYIKKILHAIHKLMNANHEAKKLFAENQVPAVIAELEAFQTALSEKLEA